MGKAFPEEPRRTSALQKPRIGRVMRLTVSNVVLKFRNSGHDKKIIEPEVICKLRILKGSI